MQWKSIVPIAGAVLIGALLGGAAIFFTRQSPSLSTSAHASQQVVGPSHAVMIGDREHMTADERAAADKRQADAISIIARSKDVFLTGDENGHAEWQSANEESITCGIAPDRRYLVVKNELGKTRYDDTYNSSTQAFEDMWNQANCQATAPVNQGKILAAVAEEKLYDETHPIDPECFMREVAEWRKYGNAATRRQFAHPHECREPRAVWEAAMPGPSTDAASAPASNAGSPADPVAGGAPANSANAIQSDQTPQQ